MQMGPTGVDTIVAILAATGIAFFIGTYVSNKLEKRGDMPDDDDWLVGKFVHVVPPSDTGITSSCRLVLVTGQVGASYYGMLFTFGDVEPIWLADYEWHREKVCPKRLTRS